MKWNLRQAWGVREGQYRQVGNLPEELLNTPSANQNWRTQSLLPKLFRTNHGNHVQTCLAFFFSQDKIIQNTEPFKFFERQRLCSPGWPPPHRRHPCAFWVLGFHSLPGSRRNMPKNLHFIFIDQFKISPSPTIATSQGLWFSFVRIKVVSWEWLL